MYRENQSTIAVSHVQQFEVKTMNDLAGIVYSGRKVACPFPYTNGEKKKNWQGLVPLFDAIVVGATKCKLVSRNLCPTKLYTQGHIACPSSSRPMVIGG